VYRRSLHLLNPAQQPRQSAALAGGDYRVLLLDDEKHSEQLVVRVLCKVVGCRVTALPADAVCGDILACTGHWQLTGLPHSSTAASCCGQVPDVDELKAKNLFETSKQLGQAIVTTALKEHAGPRAFTATGIFASKQLP
jgi:ATP-dependent Clp protease adaptor protein ClpS